MKILDKEFLYIHRPGDAVWIRDGTQGHEWKYGQVHLDENNEISYVFQANASQLFQGDIALDDIKVLDGDCPPLDYCDFESGDICGYVQDATDDFDWIRGSGNSEEHTDGTGPDFDHTYGTEWGHYMYADASSQIAGDKARLLSPMYGPALVKCLHFWYHMQGDIVGSLNVYIKEGGVLGSPVWTQTGNTGEFWHSGTVDYSAALDQYHVVFEADIGASAVGDIAIDDVQIIDHACQLDGTCNFERSMCTWTNSPREDEFDWVRYSGSTSLYGFLDLSGPSWDHTLGTEHGYYMLLDTTIGDAEGYTAMLYSESFQPGQRCFGFWYHMYGNNVGTLEVILREEKETGNGENPDTVLWQLEGDQGDVWRFHDVAISSASYFIIIVKGTVGEGILGQGDIALDDTFTIEGACPSPTPPPPFVCGDGTEIGFQQVCNWEEDCDDGSDEVNCGECTFEDDQCGYEDLSRDSVYTWVRDRNGTETSQTGPQYDHTRGDEYGYYMAVEAQDGNALSRAALQSPLLKETGAHCEIEFWYHMYGENIGFLNVHIARSGVLSRFWHLQGNQGDEWRRGVVGLGRLNSDFLIRFDASRSFDRYGDVAIDDVQMINCQMPEIKEQCDIDEIQCDRGSCVQQYQICDGTDDCGDASDESPEACDGYSGCFFENLSVNDGWCELQRIYYNANPPQPDSHLATFDWWLENGEQGLIGSFTGPGRDHTTGTAIGHYVYADSRIPRRAGDVALFRSQNYVPVTNTDCHLRFYYHMMGQAMGTLNIYVRTYEGTIDENDLVWTRSGNHGDMWIREEIVIDQASENWQILFEAIVGSGLRGYIALDDITFTPDCVVTTDQLPVYIAPTPTPTPCDPDFYCDNGVCVDMSKVCDFYDDCGDNSDEAVCGTCDFEDGQCGWFDNSNGIYRWEHFQAGSSGSIYAPITDAAGRDEGHYMLVESGNSLFYLGAFLESPVLGAMGSACEMDFWYHLHGDDTGSIFVYLQNATTFQDLALLFTVTGDQGNQWHKARIMLGGHSAGYRIDIESYPALGTITGDANDAAIDEIEFINCHPGDIPPHAYELTCDFEDGWCGWMQAPASTDEFDWYLGPAGVASVETGPGYDHTNFDGRFITKFVDFCDVSFS
ncbi:MAM and LDL-receptor class A domain-containing protein 1-like [Glandiceps talaboti]